MWGKRALLPALALGGTVVPQASQRDSQETLAAWSSVSARGWSKRKCPNVPAHEKITEIHISWTCTSSNSLLFCQLRALRKGEIKEINRNLEEIQKRKFYSLLLPS